MASYTPLPVSSVDDPLTAELVNALRENPLAIAEGAGGAPRIEVAAMGSWYRGQFGGVGNFCWASRASGAGTVNFGDVVAGSELRPAGVSRDGGGGAISYDVQGSALAGSWRSLGYSTRVLNTWSFSATLYQRVS